jgi:hypothetical protein
MKDQLGIPLKVGDKVAYSTGLEYRTTLEIGTIDGIIKVEGWEGYYKAKIIMASGDKDTNWRDEDELLSVQYHDAIIDHLTETIPEELI